MAGNISEWQEKDYLEDTARIKGGNWNDNVYFLNTWYIESFSPPSGSFEIGFRCIKRVND